MIDGTRCHTDKPPAPRGVCSREHGEYLDNPASGHLLPGQMSVNSPTHGEALSKATVLLCENHVLLFLVTLHQ